MAKFCPTVNVKAMLSKNSITIMMLSVYLIIMSCKYFRVKFQDKKTLKEYIELDNQLAEWGGTDNYVFKFEPATKSRQNSSNNGNMVNGHGSMVETRANNKNKQVRKRNVDNVPLLVDNNAPLKVMQNSGNLQSFIFGRS